MSSQAAVAGICKTGVSSHIDWGPYVAGIGIGVLSWIVFVVVATPIGVTTAGSQVAGGVAALFVGQEAVQANAYWARNPLRLDYGTLFLVGTFLGALASALASGRFRIESVPAVSTAAYSGESVNAARVKFQATLENVKGRVTLRKAQPWVR